ncbi:glucose-methanol-choline (GMC) oxidoreductase family protein [Medicago truncatula]|uniref:Glucose-methanol-choline (GMC) oxidoreductase family protein n=2 Tax=Medicago truncatula TaxID=3880 RepID=G7KER7_MEDTR|nr:glucose-methanol-choline (GMC) oxidoreductase family protein [Medicago truncatula]
MQDATSAPIISFYDYIIIGGGTAGCPLAATLSKNHRVLVLERGGSPYGNPNITNLSAFGVALSDPSPSSPAQRFISEDGVINSRARVLGGGSCLNAGFYTRASPRYVSEAEWDEKLVDESYKWVERVVAFQPPMRQWQSAVRDGLLEVGVLPYNGFTYDHIHGTKVGGTIFDHNGHRHTAADLLEYANTNTITLLLHATVHRILFTKSKGGLSSKPIAHGVLYKDARGTEHRAYLNHGTKNEIIVSAGALGSPQLLMLSGIGAAHHLKQHNISVVLHQPFVGQGMSDNPMNSVYVPSPSPVEVSLISVVGITSFGSYIEAASGATFTGSQRDFGMFSPEIGQFSKLPPKQRTPEAIAKAIERMESLDQEAFRGGFILEKILGPISTGHLELRNTDPNENPLVTFNYFQDPRDLERCIQGMNTIEKIIDSKAFSPFKYTNMSVSMLLNMTANSPVNLLPKHTNTSMSLEQFCRDTVMTIWHYHGGCQVGRVVDSDYKVAGVHALRVIDGSTFNHSPGTNPQATVMMLGRYMGVKILRERFADDETT